MKERVRKFDQVLVPLDFSSVSRLALRYGVVLARKAGGRLLLLHVVEPYTSLDNALPREAAILEREHVMQARRILPALVGPDESAGLQIATMVKSGDAVAEIARTIRDEHVDLVVMGTHGRGLLARTLIGSTTRDLLRDLGAPLMTVCRVIGEPKFKTILFATDLSDDSLRSCKCLFEFAEMARADVVLLHAVEVGLEGGAEAAVYLGESRLQEARARLERVKQEMHRTAEIKAVMAEDSVAATILRVAEESKVDIIAIAVKTPDITVEDIVRGAHVPVLCVPTNPLVKKRLTVWK